MDIALLPNEAAQRFAQAANAIRKGRWREGLDLAASLSMPDVGPGPETFVLLTLARIRLGEATVSSINTDMVRAAGQSADLRRLLVTPLIQNQCLEEAADVLATIALALPPARAERQQRAGLLARVSRWDEAIALIDDLLVECEDDISLRTSQIQYRLSAGRQKEAGAITRAMEHVPGDERLVNVMLLSLLRERDYDGAATLATRLDTSRIESPLLAGNIVQALFRARHYDAAIAAGEAFVLLGIDGPVLRSHLAQAWYEGQQGDQRFGKAIAHLEVGVRQQPENLRMVSLLGQVLLRNGNTRRALPYLEQAVAMQPAMAELRALYARALKQLGDYMAAAEQFEAVMRNSPQSSGRWHRYVAGAMAQAGRVEEAGDLFDAWVAQRSATLPASFDAGLAALWNRVDDVHIPEARLNWAWGLRSPDCPHDRAEFDRRAKWGHLADLYLLDWLECRDDQVDEAMQHLSEELEHVEAFIIEARARAPGKGVVFASAHVGAMYFGPLALELIGARSRWVASTPSVARTAYTENLISTSDQTDTQVARAFMQSLRQDYIVVIAADGAINLAAPRITFEGWDITFSEFAARTAHRMGSSSAFVAPVWRDDNRLGFVLEHLPMPDDGETADDYAQRWRSAYLRCLRAFLATKPENLRIAGGIWRHIR
ncbi:tetratricopeptide repeat protein [Novosphingobium sp. PhB57]|uniref:tetratricopeptide repeat protein n=1 Tax=Novosphingobium sp. PhB57 TaxID=2485107 RepID=UPI0010521136|nr:tetratricopeptide repeat protein [Novosphingobium sp. PhB57]TCU59819.1 tetratricopeptide repeat protein [Novosphingobium sp. PhB57]